MIINTDLVLRGNERAGAPDLNITSILGATVHIHQITEGKASERLGGVRRRRQENMSIEEQARKS